VFDGIGIRRAHLGGLSYGGWLTLNFALAVPDRVNSVILLAPAASFAKLLMSFLMYFLGPLIYPARGAMHRVFRWLCATRTVIDERLAEQIRAWAPSDLLALAKG
jgi:pimeloyl-ACP methyl ester carboxylesterase